MFRSTPNDSSVVSNLTFENALQVPPDWWLLILGIAVLVVSFWFLHQSARLHTWLRGIPRPASGPDESEKAPLSTLIPLPDLWGGMAMCYAFALFVAVAFVIYMSAMTGHLGEAWFVRTLLSHLPSTILAHPASIAPALFLVAMPAAIVAVFNFGTAVLVAQILDASSKKHLVPTSIMGAVISAMSAASSVIVLWARLQSTL